MVTWVLVALLAAAPVATCQDFTIAGEGASDWFPDRKAAGLARAACEGDERSIARALRNGADPDAAGNDGMTPLLWAVNCENLVGIEALLRAGADPNRKIPGRFSPTYAAATRANPEPLRLLLRYGGDPNTCDGDSPQRSALYAALEVGLFGHGWDNWNALLDAGADPERVDEAGLTVAINAANFNALEQVAGLLERGYDYDLEELARAVQPLPNSTEPPEVMARRDRVIRMLEERGVRFPVQRSSRGNSDG